MSDCAICNLPLGTRDSAPYRVGSMRGWLCVECGSKFSTAITKWVRVRSAEVEAERKERIKEQGQQAERLACEHVARGIAQSRMAKLALEGLPTSTRRELARVSKTEAA